MPHTLLTWTFPTGGGERRTFASSPQTDAPPVERIRVERPKRTDSSKRTTQLCSELRRSRGGNGPQNSYYCCQQQKLLHTSTAAAAAPIFYKSQIFLPGRSGSNSRSKLPGFDLWNGGETWWSRNAKGSCSEMRETPSSVRGGNV